MANNDTTNTETGNIRWLIRHKLSTVLIPPNVDGGSKKYLSDAFDYMAVSEAVENSFRVFGLTDDLNVIAHHRVMSRIEDLVELSDENCRTALTSCLTQKDVFKLIEEKANDLVHYIDAVETDLYTLKQRIGCCALGEKNK